MKVHVLVVDEDPARISSVARYAAVYLERGGRISIGRSDVVHDVGIPSLPAGLSRHRIEHRGESVFVVTVEGRRVDAERELRAGDRIAIPGTNVVLRLDLQDVDVLRHDVVELGEWTAFGIDSFARHIRRRAYSRSRRSLVLLHRAPPSSAQATNYARVAGEHRSLPALVDTFAIDGMMHRAYEFGGEVGLARFGWIAQACPAPIAARILTEVAAAATVLAAARAPRPFRRDIYVGFDGKVVVAPSALESSDVDHAVIDAQLDALAMLAVDWPSTLEPVIYGMDATTMRANIAAFLAAHEPASDDEIAAVVAGLFPDELAAELQLREEIACIDPATRAIPARNRGDRT